MSDLHMLSPLLDGMQLEETLSEKPGCTCFALRSAQGERFVLKRLSFPSDASRVEALLLSGAYPDEAAVHQYYGMLVRDLCRELDTAKALAQTGRFAGPVGYQVEPHEGVGCELYILTPRRVPLSSFLLSSEMTNLRAVNLGIDLCDALIACRSAGCLFENLKPENIFLTPTGRFLPGDLGLASLDDLQYASVSEDYLGAFSAPELSSLSACPNPTVDLYALGMVLYYVYNGAHAPFRDENTDEAMAERLRLTGKPLPPALYADYEMTEILRKACAAKPEDRFQTPEAFKQTLVFYMQRNHISDTPIVPPLILPDRPASFDDDADSADTPMRMTHKEDLDENFRRSFAPDRTAVAEAQAPEAEAEEVTEETPAEEVPEVAEEPPVEEAPAPEEETPVVEAPAPEEETPVVEAPAPEEETPVEEAPEPEEETPAAEAVEPEEEAPVEEAPEPEEKAPVEEAPEPEEEAPAAEVPEAEESVEEASDATYVDADDDAPPPKKRKKRAWLIAAVLVAVLAVGLFFAGRWYFVSLDSAQMRFSADTVFLTLETNDVPEDYVVTCIDAAGNACSVTRLDGGYAVEGLTENAEYTFTVAASEHHYLLGGTRQYTFTAPQLAHIDSFTAEAGENDDEVLLNISAQESPETSWTLRYFPANDPDAAKELHFDGRTVLVRDLQVGMLYSFELVSTERLQVLGESALQFTPVAVVRVSDFEVEDIFGTTVRLRWNSDAAQPDSWRIVCSANGMEDIVVTATDTACELSLPDLTREYTFTLEAVGLRAPARATLASDPPVLGDFSAEVSEDGTLQLRWSLLSGSISGDWKLSYAPAGLSEAPAVRTASESALTLSDLLADTRYTFTLTAADGTRVYGATALETRTPKAANCTLYGVSPSPAYSSLWYLPDLEDWNYGHLETHSTVFTATDGIALCIQVNRMNASNDTVRFDYLVRDAEGNLLSHESVIGAWSSLWLNKRNTAEIQNPAKAGSYVVEVYVNGLLLTETPFTIS